MPIKIATGTRRAEIGTEERKKSRKGGGEGRGVEPRRAANTADHRINGWFARPGKKGGGEKKKIQGKRRGGGKKKKGKNPTVILPRFPRIAAGSGKKKKKRKKGRKRDRQRDSRALPVHGFKRGEGEKRERSQEKGGGIRGERMEGKKRIEKRRRTTIAALLIPDTLTKMRPKGKKRKNMKKEGRGSRRSRLLR